MFKIPKKYSLMISIALSAVFFAVCVAGVFFAPGLSRLFISMKEHVSDLTFAHEAGYAILAAERRQLQYAAKKKKSK